MEPLPADVDHRKRLAAGAVEVAASAAVASALMSVRAGEMSTAVELASPPSRPAVAERDEQRSGEEQIEELVRSGFAAYNALDWSGLEAIYHPDMVWRYPGSVIVGRSRIIARHRTEQAANPHHDQIRSITVSGQLAYVEHTVHLTVKQRDIEWPMFAILRWDNGRLRHEQTFWGEIPDLLPWSW